MNAQQTWKRGWYLWQSGDLERGATIMHDQRRAAALERIVARQARKIDALKKTINDAIDLGFAYGDTDGSHHRKWTIDQMVRILSGDDYAKNVAQACDGSDGPNTYSWDVGIAR